MTQRIENLRVQEAVEQNSGLDHSEKDNKMMYFPDWKP